MIDQLARRPALLAGTALAALCLGGWAAPAAAQGFNGTYSVVSGSVAINPAQSDITVNSAEAVINWQVTGAAGATDVPFLSAGNSATFHEGVSFNAPDYTVLNRVLPVDGSGAALAATISFAGNVNSTFSGQQGGNIWFYSPHGIVTNGTAAFNVGSLLLTTSDIDQTSGSLYLSQAAGNQIGFLPATDPNGVVRIGAGTTISAAGNSSAGALAAYVGIFAPRIEQGGAIRSSGGVGLAAAEAGTITFDTGLVDVQISQGSAESQGNGIVHTGTTGGAASAGEVRQIQMVAMPKAVVLNMLLAGSIGFDAASAAPDGSAVILSSGWQPTTTQAEIGANLGNLQLGFPAAGQLVIGNASTSYATGVLTVAPRFASTASPGLVRFTGDAQLHAGQSVSLNATGGEQIDATGSLTINPLQLYRGEDVTIALTANPANDPVAGRLTVAGALSINASGLAGAPSTAANGVGGTGGTVAIAVDQGRLAVAGGALQISANGVGEEADAQGGTGRGGNVTLGVSGNGTISATSLDVSASGYGAAGSFANPASIGGASFGGIITVSDAGGTLGFTQLGLAANGYGGAGQAGGAGATGGMVGLTVAGQAQVWDSVTLDGSAFDVDPQSGGGVSGGAAGLPGGVSLIVTGAGRAAIGDLNLVNNGVISNNGPLAVVGRGGGVSLLINGGGQLTVDRQAILDASAFNPANPQVGAQLTGGTIAATVDGAGSLFKVNSLIGNADASLSGAGLVAGSALGGQLAVGATNGGLLQIAGTAPQLQLGALAHVGHGPVAQSIQGGSARLYVQGGTIDAPGVTLAVSAAALGDGGAFDGSAAGYSARGGMASVELLAGGTGAGSITAGAITINAKGEAVTVFAADAFADFTGPFDSSTIVTFADSGGTGQGGTARLQVQSGTLTTGAISVHASGLGGTAGYSFGGSPNQAGDGIGGSALVDQSGGTITAASLDVLSQGRGGTLADAPPMDFAAPLPGTGRGGLARFTLSGGTTSLSGALAIAARSIGGAGAAADGTSAAISATAGALGDGSLSLAELLMPAGSTGSLGAVSASVSATGTGGAGALDGFTGTTTAGGAGIAGTARYSLADGAFTITGAVLADASATGGAGGTGGNATGGTAAFLLADTLAAPATLRSTGSLRLTASPTGGAGASAAANGTASPGTTQLTVRVARPASALVVNGDLLADANGLVLAGNGFVGNFGAVPVQVNGNVTVSTTRDIAMSLDPGGGINATGALALTGQAITTTDTGTLAALGPASVLAVNSINLGGLSAGGMTLLRALNPVGNVPGPVTVAALSSGGAVTVLGSSVDIAGPGNLTFASASAVGGSLAVKIGGDLVLNAVSATGPVTVAARMAAITAPGALTFASATTTVGDLVIATGGALTLGTATAAGALDLTVPALVSITRPAAGATIVVRAPDLAIAAGGRLGQRGLTRSIILTNTAPAAGTFLGGAGQAGAWSLDTAEAARVFADGSLTIAPAANAAVAPAPVVIGNLALGYGAPASANLGTGGQIIVTTPGAIRVNGRVALATSSNADGVQLTGSAIDVVTDTGSVALTGLGGALQGTLQLSAADVRVVTAAALAALSGLPTVAGASARLDTNDGVVNPIGTVQAGSLVVSFAGRFFVQNSGVGTQFALRRGFAANSLAVTTQSASAQIAINGVLLGSGLASGGLTQRRTVINGAPAAAGGPFDPLSTINGCVIGRFCAPPTSLFAPPLETLAGLLGPLSPSGGLLVLPVIQFGDMPLFDSPPLIDEPVTGVGNDDLWDQR